jgi:hypothetical protein
MVNIFLSMLLQAVLNTKPAPPTPSSQLRILTAA